MTSAERLEQLAEDSRAAPKDPDRCLALGEALLRVNRVDEAAEVYQRAVELDPRSDLRALYWEWLGLVREMEGKLEEALDAYFQWLECDPHAISPLDRLASLLVVLGRWTDFRLLRSQYTRRVEASSTARSRESLALYRYRVMQIDGEDSQDTRAMVLEALEGDPDSLPLRYLLGLLAYEAGDWGVASGEFERVLQLDEEGRWQEQRLALGWSRAKAQLKLTLLTRHQGGSMMALVGLGSLSDLKSLDEEGRMEAARLMLDEGRYSDVSELLSDLPSPSAAWKELQAESFLGRGLCGLAQAELDACRTEIGRLDSHSEIGRDSRHRVREAWTIFGLPGFREAVARLRQDFDEGWKDHGLGAALELRFQRWEGLITPSSYHRELERLIAKYPDLSEAWQLAEEHYRAIGQIGASQLASLMRCKLEEPGEPYPMGFRTAPAAEETEVLAILDSQDAPVVVRVEAQISRQDGDQLFGWCREKLETGMILARGALRDGSLTLPASLSDPFSSATHGLPQAFRLMVTPLSPPGDLDRIPALKFGGLGCLPFAMLVAMVLSCHPPIAEHRWLVWGRLGLRGRVDGVSGLRTALEAAKEVGVTWDRLVLARAGAFQLLRCPSRLWYGQPLTLLGRVEELGKMESLGLGKAST